jgi:hypothetical protein
LEGDVETHEAGNDELPELEGTLSRLADLLDRGSTEDDEVRSSERLSTVGSSYVSLCSTLAGFCGAFVLFLLSPGLFPESTPEISIVLLLVSAFGYIYAASWSALTPLLPAETKAKRIRLSDTLFMVCNLLVWISFTIVLFSLGYTIAAIVALVLLAAALVASFTGVTPRHA